MPAPGTDNIQSPVTKGASRLLCQIKTADLCRLYTKDFQLDVARHFVNIEFLQYRECLESGARFFFPLCPADEKCYTELSRFPWYYSDNKDEYQYIGNKIHKNCEVLDVGCGSGKFAAVVSNCQFVGLEKSSSAATAGRRRGITILPVSVEEHAQVRRDSYDVVTAFQVLEHVTSPLEFLENMVACARPGGLVVTSVPAEDGALGAAVNYTLNLPPHHLTHWPDRALIHVMRQVGLQDIDLYHLPLVGDLEVQAVTQFMARALRGRRYHETLVRVSPVERMFLFLLTKAAERLRRGIVVPLGHGHTVIAMGRKPLR